MDLRATQRHLISLQNSIAALSARADALEPPFNDNPAAHIGYANRSRQFPGVLQEVLSSWLELLFGTLPTTEADEIAKYASEFFSDDLMTAILIPTARANVLGTPTDPYYVPDITDMDR